MRLHRCSRIGFRKNRRRICLALFVLLTTALPAQIAHRGTVERTADGLVVTMAITGADQTEFFRNLNDGLTTRLQFRLRISEPRPFPFTLLGARFLNEYTLEHSASWDPFRAAYVLEGPGGRETLFDDPQALWRRFFLLDGYLIPVGELPGGAGESQPVIEIRASYRPIVFVPALGVLSVFLSEDRDATGWERIALTGAAE